MKATERKKKIEEVIMATDAIMNTDWLTRLDAYIQADKKESLRRLHYFYCGAIILFAIVFIGYTIINQNQK